MYLGWCHSNCFVKIDSSWLIHEDSNIFRTFVFRGLEPNDKDNSLKLVYLCDFSNLYLSEWTLTGWLKARARINCSSQSDWRNSGPFKGCQSIAQQRRGLMTHHLHEDNQNRGVHHLHWGTRCLGHLQMYSTQSFPATVSVSIYHIINMHLDSRLSISIPAHSFIMFFDLCFQSRIVSSLHLVNRRTLPVFASIRLDYVQTYAELLRWSDQADWECSGKVSNIKKLQLTWRT